MAKPVCNTSGKKRLVCLKKSTNIPAHISGIGQHIRHSGLPAEPEPASFGDEIA